MQDVRVLNVTATTELCCHVQITACFSHQWHAIWCAWQSAGKQSMTAN